MEVRQFNSSGGQPIQVGSFEIGVTMAEEFAVALIIGHDQNDVGLARFGSRRVIRDEARGNKDSEEADPLRVFHEEHAGQFRVSK